MNGSRHVVGGTSDSPSVSDSGSASTKFWKFDDDADSSSDPEFASTSTQTVQKWRRVKRVVGPAGGKGWRCSGGGSWRRRAGAYTRPLFSST